MKPLSERDENLLQPLALPARRLYVGMKPLSERDENEDKKAASVGLSTIRRNEATL